MRHWWRNLAAACVLALAGSCLISFPAAFPAAALASSAHGEPTLGLLTGTFANGSGFGQVEPREVFNGGDPTGLVISITWHNWGRSQAVGTGRSLYVAPGQPVARGTIEPVRIVAFDLGTCNGRYMYAAVEWYFPQHKQVFDPGQFEDVCIGAYYPPQTGQYTDSGTSGGYYLLTLSGAPGSLHGSISPVTAGGKKLRTLFSFHGRAGINGRLDLISTGPFRTGRTFTGIWQTLSVTLGNCRSYLHSAPSCTFYWT